MRRFLLRAGFALSVTVFVMMCIAPIVFAYGIVHGMLHGGCDGFPPLNERIPEAEAMSFSPEDSLNLQGWFIPGTNGATVIVLPGGSGSANNMWREAEFLHQAGYNVLTYGSRSCANPPAMQTLGYREQDDLAAALNWLETRPDVDPARIGGLGFSMGGATLLLVGAEDERLSAIVATGNYSHLHNNFNDDVSVKPSITSLWEAWSRVWLRRFYEWQTGANLSSELEPIAVVGDISPRPVFLIHGALEVAYTHGDQQYAAAGEPRQFWLVAGADHGQYPDVAFEEYRTRILAFFETYL